MLSQARRVKITKQLEELFQLDQPDYDEEKEANDSLLEKAQADVITTEAYSNLEKIEHALPQVRGLEASDSEMDDLASMAISSYKDLQELGMQVESKYSAEIFGVASNMLGHAITAKTAKINKKIKMIELQLKKASLDQKNPNTKELESTPIGTGKLLDRNELLKILANKKDEK